jgi:hypothetical protein
MPTSLSVSISMNSRCQPPAGLSLTDDIPTSGAAPTTDLADAAVAGDAVSQGQRENERFAAFAEASIAWLPFPAPGGAAERHWVATPA